MSRLAARLVAAAFLSAVLASAQLPPSAPPPPQTARQALIEVIKSKDSNALLRHLPEATKAKLLHGQNGLAPEGLFLGGMGSALSSMLSSGGGTVQIEDAGPVLMTMENSRAHEKSQIIIESDDLRGDEDDIELTFHVFKNGEEDVLSELPHILLHMKMENGIWRFAQVGASFSLKLDDPKFLDSLQRSFKQTEDAAKENWGMMAVSMAVSAETEYARQHPSQGYTCSLEDLSRPAPNQTGAGNQNRGFDFGQILKLEQQNGYRVTLTGCSGSPVSSFKVTSSPLVVQENMRKAFCSDESGDVRYSLDGQADTCLTSGQPYREGTTGAIGIDTTFGPIGPARDTAPVPK